MKGRCSRYLLAEEGGREGECASVQQGDSGRLIALDREGLINNLRDAGIIPLGRYPETKETSRVESRVRAWR